MDVREWVRGFAGGKGGCAGERKEEGMRWRGRWKSRGVVEMRGIEEDVGERRLVEGK